MTAAEWNENSGLDCSHRPGRHLRMQVPRYGPGARVCDKPPRAVRNGDVRGPAGAYRRMARGHGSGRQARRGHRQRLDGGQVITATAPIAGYLTSFQRTPQYSVPAGNRELTPEELRAHRDDFEATWEQVRSSSLAMGFEESTVTTFSVTAEEREQVYQRTWDEGGGFRFMFETFCDMHRHVRERGSGQIHPS